jgi:hypothetical protein
MATTTKEKPDPADAGQAETPEPDQPAQVTKRPEDLSADERATLSRHYKALRLAATPGDAEEARERIRALLGPDAEIGDHVVVLADGAVHRVEYAGTTLHDGVPVISAYAHVL